MLVRCKDYHTSFVWTDVDMIVSCIVDQRLQYPGRKKFFGTDHRSCLTGKTGGGPLLQSTGCIAGYYFSCKQIEIIQSDSSLFAPMNHYQFSTYISLSFCRICPLNVFDNGSCFSTPFKMIAEVPECDTISCTFLRFTI